MADWTLKAQDEHGNKLETLETGGLVQHRLSVKDAMTGMTTVVVLDAIPSVEPTKEV